MAPHSKQDEENYKDCRDNEKMKTAGGYFNVMGIDGIVPVIGQLLCLFGIRCGK